MPANRFGAGTGFGADEGIALLDREPLQECLGRDRGVPLDSHRADLGGLPLLHLEADRRPRAVLREIDARRRDLRLGIAERQIAAPDSSRVGVGHAGVEDRARAGLRLDHAFQLGGLDMLVSLDLDLFNAGQSAGPGGQDHLPPVGRVHGQRHRHRRLEISLVPEELLELFSRLLGRLLREDRIEPKRP